MANFQFTNKVELALNNAYKIATDYGHSQLDPIHLTSSLLSPEENGSVSLFNQIITKTGADTTLVDRAIAKDLARLPTQDPASEQVSMSPALLKVLQTAQSTMKSQKDSYISIDHIIAALIDSPKIKTALTSAGVSEKALKVAVEQTRGKSGWIARTQKKDLRR